MGITSPKYIVDNDHTERDACDGIIEAINAKMKTPASSGRGQIYLDGRLLGEWIQGAIENGEIHVASRSLV
jgi:hypothetical protein